MGDVLARQKSAWTWGGALASALVMLPTATTRAGGGWIAPVLALPCVLLAEWMLRPLGGRGLAQGFCDVLGRRLGSVLTIIYIMWAGVLGGVQLWGSVRRAERAVELGWPGWLLATGLVLLALWLVRGDVSGCVRWSVLVLNGLLSVLSVIVLLALMRVRRDNLLPLWSGGDRLAGAVGAAIGAMCVRVYGGFLPETGNRTGVRYPAAVCGLLSLLLLSVQGGLGTEFASRVEEPLLTLTRNVGIEGTFRRAESVLAAVLLLADLLLLTLLLWGVKLAAKQAWQRRDAGRVVWVVAAGMLGTALLPAEWAKGLAFGRQVVPWVNSVLGVMVPLVLLVIARVKREKQGAYLVLGSEENGTSWTGKKT